jgi:hypothetical protein
VSKTLTVLFCAAVLLAVALVFTPVWQDIVPPWTGKAVVLVAAGINVGLAAWAIRREW